MNSINIKLSWQETKNIYRSLSIESNKLSFTGNESEWKEGQKLEKIMSHILMVVQDNKLMDELIKYSKE